MDLGVSPDLDAFYCYAVVFVLGLLTAGNQVSTRLGSFRGRWIMVNTWLLFFAYSFVPVMLFWALDRTNAVHDTSLFAAILVGFGYQQILSGSIASIQPAGDISKIWQPFAVWADSIADRIGNRIIVNDSRFDEKLLQAVRENEAKFQRLRDQTFAHATDLPALETLLAAVDNHQPALDADVATARKSAILYGNLKQSSPQTFDLLLFRNQITSLFFYLWYAKEFRSKTTAFVVALLLAVFVAWGIRRVDTPENLGHYYVWRLQRNNTTDFDRFRAKRELLRRLRIPSAPYDRVAALMRTPNLPVKTADDVLGLLIEAHSAAASQGVDLLGLLFDSLRTENADIRRRIQDTLLYLSEERGLTIPKDLQDWKPDAKDSAADVDQMIKKWQQVKR
jgi:hypothetical protein